MNRGDRVRFEAQRVLANKLLIDVLVQLGNKRAITDWLNGGDDDALPAGVASEDQAAGAQRATLPGAGAGEDEQLPAGIRRRVPGGDQPELRAKGQ